MSEHALLLLAAISAGMAFVTTAAHLVLTYFDRKSNRKMNTNTEATEDAVQKLEQRIESTMQETLNAMSQTQSHIQDQVKDLLAKLSSLQHDLQEQQNLLTRMQRSEEDIQHQFSQLIQQRTEIEHELSRKREESQEAQAKNHELEQQKKIARQEAETAIQELTDAQSRDGSAEIPAEQGAISQAALEAYSLIQATPQTEQLRAHLREHGSRVVSAVEAGVLGDSESAATLIDSVYFDPFKLPKELWKDAFAAKRRLENARMAGLKLLESHGYRVDWPIPGETKFDADSHELRDSLETDQEQLKGIVAEVRRPGFWYQGRPVRPARVVQFVFDYTKYVGQTAAEPAGPLPDEPDLPAVPELPQGDPVSASNAELAENKKYRV